LAGVQIGGRVRGKWGVIDRMGNIILAPKFD